MCSVLEADGHLGVGGINGGWRSGEPHKEKSILNGVAGGLHLKEAFQPM